MRNIIRHRYHTRGERDIRVTSKSTWLFRFDFRLGGRKRTRTRVDRLMSRQMTSLTEATTTLLATERERALGLEHLGGPCVDDRSIRVALVHDFFMAHEITAGGEAIPTRAAPERFDAVVSAQMLN